MRWRCGCGHEIDGDVTSPPFSCPTPSCSCSQCSRSQPWFVAFTVGKREIYDPLLLRADPRPMKLGFRRVGDPVYPEGCEGGSVWRTKKEAQSYLDAADIRGYAVYEVGLPVPFTAAVRTVPDETGMCHLDWDADILREA